MPTPDIGVHAGPPRLPVEFPPMNAALLTLLAIYVAIEVLPRVMSKKPDEPEVAAAVGE